MDVGERLAELRKDHRYKQKDIAKMLNVAISTVSNYEQGKHEPDLMSLCRLADLYNVSTDYLLGRTELTFGIDSLTDTIEERITKADVLEMLGKFSKKDREYLIRTLRLIYYHYQPRQGKEKSGAGRVI